MTEQEKRLHRCCFTGHRPEKINWAEDTVRQWLKQEIVSAVRRDYITFISGMARGVDIWAAECILELKADGYPIHLICAAPYNGFEESWSHEWQNRYNRILDKADLVRFISPTYSRSCFQVRNEWMVDHSALVLAVYNGQSGGTKNTIEYARKHNIKVIVGL